MSFLVDFTKLDKSNYLYGGNAGLKRGIVWNNKKWLIKFPQDTSTFSNVEISFTTSPLSEYIGSHIYEILGYKTHKTVLGTFFNERIQRVQLVVACEDFTDDGKLKLIDYEAIKNNYSDELQYKLSELRYLMPPYKTSGISAHTLPIEEILLQFKENSLFASYPESQDLFWEMMIIDCLINNNDRNKNNWGFLYNPKTDSFVTAPIYDNGASFVSKHTDEKLLKLLDNPSALQNSALNGMCYYTVDNELVNFRNFFRKVKENKYDRLLIKAFKKVLPLIENKWEAIVNLIMSMPNSENGIHIISDIQKEFFIQTMRIRLDKLLKTLY